MGAGRTAGTLEEKGNEVHRPRGSKEKAGCSFSHTPIVLSLWLESRLIDIHTLAQRISSCMQFNTT